MTGRRQAPDEEPVQVCAEPVWDGPYRMTCGHYIVRGRCIRHGSDGLTRTSGNASGGAA